MPRLRQVKRKPREKKPRQRRYAVLTDVDPNQHAMAQQHLYRGPGQRVLLHAPLTFGIYQAAAALDGLNLRRRNARMVRNPVDVCEPDDRQRRAQGAQEPEAALPSELVQQPAEDRRKNWQSEVLR